MTGTETTDRPGIPPSRLELALLILTGVGHVGLEVASDGLKGAADSITRPQHVYNLCAAVGWGAYLVWRAVRKRGMLAEWGFRREGFLVALRESLLFAAVGAVPLLAFGWMKGRLPLPITFWMVLALYPLWGLAQQFALQGLITRNLRGVVPSPGWRVAIAATLFSAAHFPTWWLMGLTWGAGLMFTWVFERHRNVWAVGLVHGLLGSLAYYLVLGKDPGAELLGMLNR